MRFLLYNIAYGTGAPLGYTHGLLTLPRYLVATRHHMQYLRRFLKAAKPDIVGMVEIDKGSFRSRGRDNAEEIARELKHNYTYSIKYHDRSPGRWLPLLRHQGNAMFAENKLEECQQHFMPMGFKRLVLEATVNGIRVFLVHLSLNKRTRERQLEFLSRMIKQYREPLVMAGDFNSFQGKHELADLINDTGLRNVNTAGNPTFPAWKPRKELDFILVSEEINIERFKVLSQVRLSDHLPLLLDFKVN